MKAKNRRARWSTGMVVASLLALSLTLADGRSVVAQPGPGGRPPAPSLDALDEALDLNDDQREAVGSALDAWGSGEERVRPGARFLEAVAPALSLEQTADLITYLDEHRRERPDGRGEGRREGRGPRKMRSRDVDGKRGEPRGEPRVSSAERVEFLTAVLKLDAAQAARISELVEKQRGERDAVHDAIREELNDDQRKVLDAMKEARPDRGRRGR